MHGVSSRWCCCSCTEGFAPCSNSAYDCKHAAPCPATAGPYLGTAAPFTWFFTLLLLLLNRGVQASAPPTSTSFSTVLRGSGPCSASSSVGSGASCPSSGSFANTTHLPEESGVHVSSVPFANTTNLPGERGVHVSSVSYTATTHPPAERGVHVTSASARWQSFHVRRWDAEMLLLGLLQIAQPLAPPQARYQHGQDHLCASGSVLQPWHAARCSHVLPASLADAARALRPRVRLHLPDQHKCSLTPGQHICKAQQMSMRSTAAPARTIGITALHHLVARAC